ncbi:MAG: pilin [Candidatus Woesebacteria bacterium]|nr:pilin [Candidatus Woesebacteria bacterium]
MEPATLSNLEGIFENVVSYLLALGGIVLFILLLSGGFKYLTSGGDPKAVEGAKKTLTTAIGGLVMLAGSYLILRLIADFTLTNDLNSTTSILKFKIFKP